MARQGRNGKQAKGSRGSTLEALATAREAALQKAQGELALAQGRARRAVADEGQARAALEEHCRQVADVDREERARVEAGAATAADLLRGATWCRGAAEVSGHRAALLSAASEARAASEEEGAQARHRVAHREADVKLVLRRKARFDAAVARQDEARDVDEVETPPTKGGRR